jgi:hypothetical protein
LVPRSARVPVQMPAKATSSRVAGEPDDVVLFGFGVGLQRVFGKAVERDEAAVLRLQPSAMGRRRVADVGHGRAAGSQGRRHAPSHGDEFGAMVGVAHHRRGLVGKHAGHRRQVADIAIDNAEQRDDGGLAACTRLHMSTSHCAIAL